MPDPPRPPGWLPKAEFDWIFSRVTRLCVEVVIVTPAREVLLARRDIPPNLGAWHIPGGTVLFGEPLVEAVKRVARDELGLDVAVGELLGYIEYPSHYENGLDSPVGLAFRTEIVPRFPDADGLVLLTDAGPARGVAPSREICPSRRSRLCGRPPRRRPHALALGVGRQDAGRPAGQPREIRRRNSRLARTVPPV